MTGQRLFVYVLSLALLIAPVIGAGQAHAAAAAVLLPLPVGRPLFSDADPLQGTERSDAGDCRLRQSGDRCSATQIPFRGRPVGQQGQMPPYKCLPRKLKHTHVSRSCSLAPWGEAIAVCGNRVRGKCRPTSTYPET